MILNDNEVQVNPDGSFSQKIQLIEGPNNITVKAISPSGQSGEYRRWPAAAANG